MQNYKNIADWFQAYDLKGFIEANQQHDSASVALGLKPEPGVDKHLLIEQLTLYKKAQRKLPAFAEAYCYFTARSLEQATAEPVARYKATLFEGHSLLDLSGGLGADDWAFARSFHKVVSLDMDATLNKLVRFNFTKLGKTNIDRRDAEALQFLHTDESVFDMIYLDADRRTAHKKAVSVDEGEPALRKVLPLVWEKSSRFVCKFSPLIDVQHVCTELPNVSQVFVISLLNEVKEVLVLMEKGFAGKPLIHAIDIRNEETKAFDGYPDPVKIGYGVEGAWFFEPALALIKSGLAVHYAAQQGLRQLGINTLYFTGTVEIPGFFGRSFQVVHSIAFSKSAVQAYVKRLGMKQANISRRNFPVDPDAIKKMLGLKDGGDDYLFFGRAQDGTNYFFHCRKAGN